MKEFTILRGHSDDEGTFGIMPELALVTLELPWRDNHPHKSCVPAGSYTASIYNSPTKGRVYLLEGVPSRDFVEIHSANFAGDTDKGWQSQLLGCIALGLSHGQLENIYDNLQQGVLNSRTAISRFMAAAEGQPIRLTIQDGGGK